MCEQHNSKVQNSVQKLLTQKKLMQFDHARNIMIYTWTHGHKHKKADIWWCGRQIGKQLTCMLIYSYPLSYVDMCEQHNSKEQKSFQIVFTQKQLNGILFFQYASKEDKQTDHNKP